MTKDELIAHIAEETAVSKTNVRVVLDSLASTAATHLATSTEDFALPGIGKLATGVRQARTGRNPRTGETVNIPASVSVKFKPAKALKDAVN